MKTGKWKIARWGLFAAVMLLALPVVQVGCVRFANPPFTPEMLRFRLGPKSPEAAARGLRFKWVRLADVPPPFLHFVWASEDQRFFKHSGIDFIEIDEALKESKKTGRKPRGGSTITQQCARSTFLWQGRSWTRKAIEAYYTFWMERILSKRRIFELYVNVIEFGEGIYGISAAAATFHHVQPDRLSRDQMAMLAAVLPNPRGWSPAKPSARLKQRQQRVLALARKAPFPSQELR